jgi:hypothetical protein
VFTARYALIPYIKQTHFVFKGLIYIIVGASGVAVVMKPNNFFGFMNTEGFFGYVGVCYLQKQHVVPWNHIVWVSFRQGGHNVGFPLPLAVKISQYMPNKIMPAIRTTMIKVINKTIC